MGKLYSNQEHGFEIELPELWRGPGVLTRLIAREQNPGLRCGPGEAFNFEVGPLVPEPALHETEREFRDNARSRGYTELEFGRIRIEQKDHVWAKYRMLQGLDKEVHGGLGRRGVLYDGVGGKPRVVQAEGAGLGPDRRHIPPVTIDVATEGA